jgi:prolyl-tRNA editing enzyme YbaK/EbsC (Cys-tRNA(Pro) deacylase)
VLHPNAQRVQAALIAAGSQAEVRQLPESARTSGEAAAALGVAVEQIAKSLVFLADGKPAGTPHAVFPTTFDELLVIAAGQGATVAEDRARQPPS